MDKLTLFFQSEERIPLQSGGLSSRAKRKSHVTEFSWRPSELHHRPRTSFIVPQDEIRLLNIRTEMQRALSPSVAPSSSLLRFLRSKIEEPAFFLSATVTLSNNCSGHSSGSSKRKGGSAPGEWERCSNLQARKNHESSEASIEPSIKHRQVATHHSNLLGCWSTSKSPRLYHRHGWLLQRYCKPLQHIFKRSIWKRNSGRRSDADAKARELPPLPSFLDDTGGTTLGRTKAAKPGSELKLRCTEIDNNGNVITVNGEFKKSELIAKVSTALFLKRFPHPSHQV